MSKNVTNRNRIFIFNLETNLDSQVIAAAHEWVEVFAENYEFVEVYSTHVGRTELGENVKILELGGGNVIGKISNLFRLSLVIPRLWKYRQSAVVFHHMSSRTLAILGLPVRILGIPQGIWYSHSKLDRSLKFGQYFANYIFSSTEKAIPLKGRKVFYLGHGIKISEINRITATINSEKRAGIVSLGRIARIKRLEEILFESSKISNIKIPVTFIGPVTDSQYCSELLEMANKLDLEISIPGPLPYSKVAPELRKYKYIFSGTPNSVDKALLEGAIAGCFVVSSNTEALKLSGMEKVWKKLGQVGNLSLEDQLRSLENLPSNLEAELRSNLVQNCISSNDLVETVKKIKTRLNS